jgi:hypothetical protein
MKIFRNWLSVFGSALGIILLFVGMVCGEIVLALLISKWTDQMEFFTGIFIMVVCYALLIALLLSATIACIIILIKLIKLMLADSYKSDPQTVRQGTETIYDLLKGIKDKKKQIGLATIFFLIFLDSIPPLQKIFKSYLKRLRKEMAPNI